MGVRMGTRIRQACVIAATVALASALLLPPAEAATGAAAAITKLPAKISVVNGGNPYVDVQVSYSCENTQTRTYYLEASLDGANGAHRVLGFRNDTGGLVTADCNHHGAKSEILRFLVGSYSPVVPLVKGEATLLVTLDPRGGPATPGGWYISTGTPVTASKTLPVK